MQNNEYDDEEEDWDDAVEDWELLGLDPDTPQEEIDDMWENQMQSIKLEKGFICSSPHMNLFL